MRLLRNRKAFAVVAAAALLVTACSSSGSSSSDHAGGGGTSSDSSSASGTPIKIGTICSCTGPTGSTFAAIGDVAKAWAKSVNAAGGIAGHPVDLIFKDDANNPGTSVTAVQSLISDDVAAIIDASNLEAAWGKAAATAKIPVIGGLFAAEEYYHDPDFYPTGQTDDSAAYADVLTAKTAGATNLGHLYCAEAPTCQKGVAAHKAAGKQLGVPLVYSAAISATAPNYTAQCLAAKQAGVTALFIGDAPPIVAHIAQDCTRQGYKPIYVLQGGAFTDMLATTPGLKDTLWMTWSILPYFADTAAVRKMTSAVDKYYPGLRKNADSWSGLAPQVWTAGLLIEKAVQEAGTDPDTTITGTQLVKVLDSLHNERLDGWSPPLTFTAGKPHPVGCWFTARVQHGKPVLANGGKLSCKNGS